MIFIKGKSLFFLLCLQGSAFTLTAQIVDSYYKNNQPKENSPFSAIGLGNFISPAFGESAGMGGLTAGYRDISSLNFENPAASTALRVAAYGVGLYLKENYLSGGGANYNGITGNLNYLALGFPTYSALNEVLDRNERKFRWSMGFALTPFSTVGYNVSTSAKHPGTDTAKVVGYDIGSGGTYRLLWNNGVQYKNLSVGINIGYIFGNMSYDNQLTFSNLNNSYSNIYNQDYKY